MKKLDKSNNHVGLMPNEVIENQKKYGKNILITKKSTPIFIKFLKFLIEPMMLLLLLAAAVALGVAIYHVVDPNEKQHDQVEIIISFIEPAVIFLIVILNSIFGTIQENNAEKSINALEKLTSPNSKVIRDSKMIVIHSEDLTVGDILVVESGDQVTGDGIIVESSSFEVDEALLTGESVPVAKSSDAIAKNDAPLAERTNYVFSGTNVTKGRALILIEAIGMKTEIGKISSLINKEADHLTPLQKKVNKLGRMIGILSAILCVLTFFIYLMVVANIIQTPSNFGKYWHVALLISITLAIGTIPEGLIPIITVILSFGVKRLSKKNALVKKISSAETLGNVSVICSDKTGTLTQNKMTVVKTWIPEIGFVEKDLKNNEKLIKYASLCTDSNISLINNEINLVGDPTETSILKFGHDISESWNKNNLVKEFPRVFDLPFDSDRKMMTVVVQFGKKFLVITKGAPDRVFLKIKTKTEMAEKANNLMGNDALRVLAVGFKIIDKLPSLNNVSDLENDLELLGLIGIIDPPREEAKLAIAETKAAGIKTVMITGDHLNTARAISIQLGILNEGEKIITGAELAKYSQEQLEQEIENISVYARTSPNDKIRIVKAWQSKNKVVSMTGDGVNDAPALKASDIGCAMGITGTDVSKQAADLILTDDNFATIANAVKEGRRLLDNIKRLMVFLFATNIAIMLVTILGIMIFQTNPLSALQILWINVVGETLPGIALGINRSRTNLMNKKPEDKNASIVSKKMFLQIVALGSLASLISLVLYYLGTSSFYDFDFNLMVNSIKSNDSYSHDATHFGSSLAFMALGLCLASNSFVVRSKHTIFFSQWKDIKYFLASFLASVFILVFVTYIPILNLIFNMNPFVGNYQWMSILPFIIVMLMILTGEIIKLTIDKTQINNPKMNKILTTQ